jgi:hypothetical protein
MGVHLELTMKGLRGEGCPWVATDASLLPLPSFLQSLLQSLPPLVSRVLAYFWVGRESVLQMRGWVRESSFNWELSHFMLTCGYYSLKWQTTHFPSSGTVLRFIGWSGRYGGLSSISLSLLNWFNHWVGWYWGSRCHVLGYSLALSWCWWCQ